MLESSLSDSGAGNMTGLFVYAYGLISVYVKRDLGSQPSRSINVRVNSAEA